MTLIGALLTAMVMAREWERGTMEALMVTPVTMREVLIGKLVPYFILGMGGMALSVAMAVVAVRGAAARLALGAVRRLALFLLAALGMGLLISTVARSQFVAGQIAIIATFLPAFLLSGFIFDIGSMPPVVQVITHIVAARYFVAHPADGVPGRQRLVGDPAQRAGAGADGGDLPRPDLAQAAQATGVGQRCCGRILALVIKGVPGPAEGQAEPHRADRPAADPVDGVRLRSHLRPEARAVRGVQRGSRPGRRATCWRDFDGVAQFHGRWRSSRTRARSRRWSTASRC